MIKVNTPASTTIKKARRLSAAGLSDQRYLLDLGAGFCGAGACLIVSTTWVDGRACACFTVVNSPVLALRPILLMVSIFLPKGRYKKPANSISDHGKLTLV